MSSGSMHENSGSRSQADLNQIEMENVADSLPEEPLLRETINNNISRLAENCCS